MCQEWEERVRLVYEPGCKPWNSFQPAPATSVRVCCFNLLSFDFREFNRCGRKRGCNLYSSRMQSLNCCHLRVQLHLVLQVAHFASIFLIHPFLIVSELVLGSEIPIPPSTPNSFWLYTIHIEHLKTACCRCSCALILFILRSFSLCSLIVRLGMSGCLG